MSNFETNARFLEHGVEVTQTDKATGVKSTKLVDYNSFFEAINKNITLQTGLMPVGCRYMSRKGGYVIAMLEEPPRIESMEYHDKGKKTPLKAKIPMPGFLIGVKMKEGQGVVDAKVWALKTAIKSIDDIVYLCPLGNAWAHRHDSGKFCWGNTTTIWKDIQQVHQLRSMINIFYTSKFNSDLGGKYNIPANLSDKKIEGLWDFWKYLKGKKEFPTQVLVEAGTFKSALKSLEGRGDYHNDIPF